MFIICSQNHKVKKKDCPDRSALFIFCIQLFEDAGEVLPVLRIQLCHHGDKSLPEFVGSLNGLDGEAHDCLLCGLLPERLAFTGAQPDLVAAKFTADICDRSVAGFSYARAKLRYEGLRNIEPF